MAPARKWGIRTDLDHLVPSRLVVWVSVTTKYTWLVRWKTIGEEIRVFGRYGMSEVEVTSGPLLGGQDARNSGTDFDAAEQSLRGGNPSLSCFGIYDPSSMRST